MATKTFTGLKAVTIGAIAVDGGMGTVLTELLGATVKGAATLVYTPPQFTDIEIEETDEPIDSLPSGLGSWELSLETYNISAETLYALFGGTLTGTTDKVWGMPATFTPTEQSVQIETRTGQIIAIPRMKIMPAPNFAFTKSDLGKMAITGRVLTPTKVATPSITFANTPA